MASVDSNVLNETIQSGIIPLKLLYTSVFSPASRQVKAYRSIMQINSLVVGVILPEQYQQVANRTAQCVSLAQRNLTLVCDDIDRMLEAGIEFDWVSVHAPVRMLMKTDVVQTLEQIFTKKKFNHPEKVCLEIPSEILFEDKDTVSGVLDAIRKIGVLTAIKDFGSDFCPTMRLSMLRFDYALVSELVTEQFGSKNTILAASTVVSYVRNSDIKVIVAGAETNELVEQAYHYDCSGYTREEEPFEIEAIVSGQGGE